MGCTRESSLMVEHHLVKVGDGGSSPLFPVVFCFFYSPFGGMVDTADSKSAFCWFKPGRGYSNRRAVNTARFYIVSPGDGMVDVLDLGSSFWEFKSPPGHPARLVEW